MLILFLYFKKSKNIKIQIDIAHKIATIIANISKNPLVMSLRLAGISGIREEINNKQKIEMTNNPKMMIPVFIFIFLYV